MMYNYRWTAELPQYMNDVPEAVRAYAPYITLDNEAQNALCVNVFAGENYFEMTIEVDGEEKFRDGFAIEYAEDLLYKKLTKRFVKNNLHAFCRDLTGIELPYGSLTGVRPTKLLHELSGNDNDPIGYLKDTFSVSEDRAKLIADVVKNQEGIYNADENGIDIFVNVPFCPTRCKYCSFISTELGRIKKQIPAYIAGVKGELEAICDRVEREKLNVRSIYVGGGTPTSLNAQELKEMLSPLAKANYGVEFTVEAGRPDSITREKFAALKEMRVTRVSINPQTFKDETLVKLGRAHTSAQVYDAMAIAREFEFDVNMDLIAGLPDESFEDFKSSLQKCIDLQPENVTVHTLAIKRGATFKLDGVQKDVSGAVKQMVDYARETLFAYGYKPYYMYRQKNMADNLENVGYAKDGKRCVYNIDYMEETNSILSAGAGAMSKTVYHKENRIERSPNPKGLNEYLAKTERN